MDRGIAAKLGIGAFMLAVSTGLWFSGRFWPWGWAIGVIFLLWGLMTIGDKKNEWERPD